jgi:protein transport protein SEC23
MFVVAKRIVVLRSGKAAMVDKELTKEIRSHKDLEKDAAPFWRSSVQYYVDLTQTLVKNSLTLDVFACALEQSGLAEMKPAIQASGGLAVQTDTFRNPVFKDSLMRVFSKVNDAGFVGRCSCGVLEVHVSRNIKVMVSPIYLHVSAAVMMTLFMYC